MIEFQLYEFIALLLTACAVGVAVKFIRLPYTIALVIVGLLVGIFKLIPEVPLTKDVVFLLILPPLLFEGALNMDLDHLRENIETIAVLAIVGVLISALSVGLILHSAIGIPLTVAMLFGAMISPTDPVSVLATFRNIGAPKRLATILEGESILNDGTGVVLFGIILDMLKRNSIEIFGGFLKFVVVCFGGLAVGFVLGYLAYKILSYIDDHLIEVSITLILAYSSFLIAEDLHLSGVMAVVCSGLIIGNYGRTFSMSPSTRVVLTDFWSIVVFVINSIVFLLIGIDTHLEIFSEWRAIAIAIVAVLVARALAVYVLTPRLPMSWRHVVFWGGLHGAIPVALALSLGRIPYRDLLASMTFGVVLFSLLIQGLTLEFLVRRMFGRRDREFEITFARLLAMKRAMAELRRLVEEGILPLEISKDIEGELIGEISKLERVIASADEESISEIRRKAIRTILNAQKSAIREAVMKGLISEEVARELIREIDSKFE